MSYKMIVEQIPKEQGGGYCAYIPELGKHAFCGDGETEQEAINNLYEITEYLLKKYKEIRDEMGKSKINTIDKKVELQVERLFYDTLLYIDNKKERNRLEKEIKLATKTVLKNKVEYLVRAIEDIVWNVM